MKGYMRTVLVLIIGAVIGQWWATHRGDHGALTPSTETPSASSTMTQQEPEEARGDLWFADFESAEEITKHWKTRSVVATPSEEHVTHGKFSAKVTYQQAEAPAFQMEDYLSGDRRRRDWRGYETLSFDIYNAQQGQERVILQLKDKDGREYKEDIFINGKSSQHISVRLPDLKEYLNLAHMAQFDLFRWKPRWVGTFYLDAVRLQPTARRPEGSGGQATGSKITPIAPAAQWQLAWASSLVKLPRDPAKFEGYTSTPMQMSLARLEYESAQLVLIGGSEPAQVKVSIGPLTHVDSGATFPSDVIEVRQVGYVQTQQPYYPVSYVGEWPDPLPPADAVDVPAGGVQPVWITLGAPEFQQPGRYRADITVSDMNGRVEHLPLEVAVWNFTLPRMPHLKSAFDFYRYRLEKAYREWVPGGSAWEGRFGELQNLYFLDMIKHRIAPVIGGDPTNAGFLHDVDFYLQLGLSAFGVGSRGGSNGNNWPKDGNELQQVMGWYRQAAEALRNLQLLDTAYVYTYDEPSPGDPHVAQVMEYIHRADPKLKNLLVMDNAPDPVQHAEWLKDADILCIRIGSYDPEHAKKFTELGKEMWMYISSPSHPFPALVIDYPAMAHRILPWMCWKFGAKGLLYWCVNFWNGDPWANPANYTEDQNGNGSLYYPTDKGPVPSIRLEVLRDGFEDYEYLYHLRELIETAKTQKKSDAATLEEAERLAAVDASLVDSLRSYSKNPEVLLAQRKAIAQMIEKLAAVVKDVPTAAQ